MSCDSRRGKPEKSLEPCFASALAAEAFGTVDEHAQVHERLNRTWIAEDSDPLGVKFCRAEEETFAQAEPEGHINTWDDGECR